MQQDSDALINETGNVLNEVIFVLTRNIQILKNITPEDDAQQILLQLEIKDQENVLRRTKELLETVNRHLEPEPIKDPPKPEPTKDPPPKSAIGPNYHITVILPDGREICHRHASKTFAQVVEEIGVEEVKELDLTMSGIPLIDTIRNPIYGQQPSGSYYITTYSDTDTKIERLNEIKQRLW